MVNSVSHAAPCFDIRFDDERLVANAGLLLIDTLATRLGIQQLVDTFVHLGDHPGAPNAGRKILSLVLALVAGGDCIDDVGLLRAGATEAVLSHSVAAPSTCGTHLRGYTFGHSKQLEKVTGGALERAWAAGAGPGSNPFTMDLDSTITEVCGYKKEGASYGYTHALGYHPLLATRVGSGEILHIRQRKGSANTQRGVRHFLGETLRRVRAAGATGKITVRMDSGFYSEETLAFCARKDLLYSVTVPLNRSVKKVVDEIPEGNWRPISYTAAGEAMVAQTVYKERRLVVRRTRLLGKQLELWPDWRYHAFVTNRDDDATALDEFHRQHAQVELEIRECKEGAGLRHAPSGRYGANAAWVILASLAHNLIRWAQLFGTPIAPRISAKSFRARFIAVAGRFVRHARRWTLHLPNEWAWERSFLDMHSRLSRIAASP